MNGRTFGDFVVKEQIGEGGGGEVYLAEQLTLGREAVIKILTRTDSPLAAERFLREARLASQLDHPFAAHVYGFGKEPDGALWIAMELVRGTPLSKVIAQQGPIALPRFVPFCERLCEVLHAAHEQGIVHRDIKPANVMVLSRAGRLLPKLLDLGIARRGADGGDVLVAGENEMPDEDTNTQAPATLSTTRTMASQLAQAETMDLTQVGVVIGTPAYMPPEQWVDASSADARSDQYSLAIVAYQALTGELPFKGKTLKSLARAHMFEPLPPMPDSVPTAIYGVLSRGAAKPPSERYASTLEFAAELRAASGIGLEPFALPQLDESLRENLLSEAPQPLAEAVALLESARTPRQQLESVFGLRRLVSQHLAVLALACRARIGPGGSLDSPQLVSLFQKLATTTLDEKEWLHLAREVCRPFAFLKMAHPLPELVTFFFSGQSDAAEGAGSRALEAFDAIRVPEKGASDEAVHATLMKLVPAIGQVLQGLAFLFDYPLLVQKGGAERWMGTRRSRRMVQQVSGAAPTPDQPFLVDAVGLPILTLAPLLQVFAPGAAMPDELFYLDGEGRHGARMTALPSPYERQSADVWPWFSNHIFDVHQSSRTAQKTERTPYKGLSTFTADDADNYFGREHEAETFANRLRISSLLAVVGPSGSGKSSFVLAGVLPLLPTGWRAIVTRPGAAPFEALATRLGLSVSQLTARAVLASLEENESLLIVVDQFEELVTLCSNPQTREHFAALLVELAETSEARLKVVLTLRDDFLIRVQQLSALRERMSSALQLLGTPARQELLRVVTEPAKRVGFGFDDDTLPARMVDEVAEYPGALALLSFTASQLWEVRDRHLHQMRAKTYDALGGVGGALAHHAERTLSQMAPEEAKLVREAFRHLVTSQATRAVFSRKEMLDVLGNSAAAHSVLEKLINARLLVTSEDASGDDRIEIIHEALIVSWPRLADWLREDAETARLRDALRASAKQWAERGRASGLLWRKETLAEYRVWRTRFGGRLTELEEGFARASLREESRARSIRRGLASLAVLTLVLGLVFLFRAYRQSENRLQRLWQEQGRLANIGAKPMEAFVYTEAAKMAGAKGRALEAVLSSAQSQLQGANGLVALLPGGAVRVEISPDQQWAGAFSASEIVLISRTSNAQYRWPMTGCSGISFSADSKYLVAACEDLETIDTQTREIARVKPATTFLTIERTSDGRFVGAVQGDTVYSFSPNGETKQLFRVPGAPYLTVSPASNGHLYVYAGPYTAFSTSPHQIIELDADGTEVWHSENQTSVVMTIVEDPGFNLLVLNRSDETVATYDSKTHELLWETPTTPDGIRDAIVDSDGDVVSVGAEGMVTSRKGRTGKLKYSKPLNQAANLEIVKSADPRTAFVGGADGIVRKIDTSTGVKIWEHHGHHGLIRGLKASSREVLSASQDGTLWSWDVHFPKSRQVTRSPIITSQSAESFVAATSSTLVEIISDGGVTEVPYTTPENAGALIGIDSPRPGVALLIFENQLLLLNDGHSTQLTPSKAASGATISFDLKQVAITLQDQSSEVLSLVDGKRTKLAQDGLQSFVFSATRLAASTSAGPLLVWERSNLNDPPEQIPAHSGFSGIARTSLPNVALSVGVDRRLLVWNLDDLSKPTMRIEALPDMPIAMNLSADATTLYALLREGRVLVYDGVKGSLLAIVATEAKTETGGIFPPVNAVFSQGADLGLISTPLSSTAVVDPCRLTLGLQQEELRARDLSGCVKAR